MSSNSENPLPIDILQSWLRKLAKEKEEIKESGGLGGSGISSYPENYLGVISVLSGIGYYDNDSDMYKLAKGWETRVKEVNDGKFDPVKLYELMRDQRLDPKNE